jgi:hypothetical protein
MTTLYLNVMPNYIEITADLDVDGRSSPSSIRDVIRPGKAFGGFSYNESRSWPAI